jgi:hypothetical protein
MNDTELDEMLDRWQAPAMRESLRESLRAGFIATPRRANRRGLLRRIMAAAPRIPVRRLAVVAMSAAAILFALIQVAPRTVRMASPGFRIPFYVEFDFYSNNRSGQYRSRITSFPWGVQEINMTIVESRGSLLDPVRKIAGSIRTQFVLAMPSLVLPKHPPMTEPAWFAGFVRSGCTERRTVVGHETIAGYETTVTESPSPKGRFKFWMAPDLACFTLKMTIEERQPDGSYRFLGHKEAVRVTMNP